MRPDRERATADRAACPPLYGRGAELDFVRRLPHAACAGTGGSLLIVAGPGLGRSALLDAAAVSAGDTALVLRTRAVAAERDIPYSGLHALLTPVAPRLRDAGGTVAALADALHPMGGGIRTGRRPDTGAVGGALLALLREFTTGSGGGRRPVVLCVDDAHLLDPASREALGFTARRLGPPLRAAMLLAVAHECADEPAFAGIAALRLTALPDTDAGALLDALLPEGAPPAVREALLHEGCGNPRMLTDLVAGLTPAQRSGAAPLPDPLPVDGPLLRHCTERVRALPPDTRLLLLLAAAAQQLTDTVDADTLLNAAGRAGLAPVCLEPAETARVVRTEGSRIRFGHPMLRRAVYEGEPLARRRAAHALLAEVLGGHGPTHRLLRLRHRAAAADQPDPLLADVLAAAATATPSAANAHADIADALARAADLTEDADVRVARLTAAAEHACLAGRPHRARALLAAARGLPARPGTRGRAELVRGTLELRDGVVTDAREILLHAAALLEPRDPTSYVTALLQAAEAAWAAGDIAGYLSDMERIAASGGARGDRGGDRREGGLPYGRPAHGGDEPPEQARPAGAGAAVAAAGRRPVRADGTYDPAPLGAPARYGRPVRAQAAEPGRTVLGEGAGPAWALRVEPAHPEAGRARVLRAVRSPEDSSGEPSEPPKGGGRDLIGPYCAGMAAVLGGRFHDGAGHLRQVLALAAREDEPERLIRAGVAALVVGEIPAARELNTRALAAARVRGLGTLVPQALERLVYAELRAGRHTRARSHALAGLRAAGAAGQRNCAAHHHAALAMAAAVEGDDARCAEHARAAGEDAGPHGLGVAATLAVWAQARADLGRGRPREAAARLRPLVGHGTGRGHFALRMLVVPCLVEAAVLSGAPEVARAVLPEFEQWAAATADPQAPAQLVRCRALLAGAADSDALFARALVLHDLADGDFERARTLLLRGKTLRRSRRPRDAREHLRDALVAFERCGAYAWAEQARAELRATGGAGRAATAPEEGAPLPPALRELTPQQLRIARCVAEGATNREVAVRLSVSPRTVDHHLRNVFSALGIRSRVELTRLLADTNGDGGGDVR